MLKEFAQSLRPIQLFFEQGVQELSSLPFWMKLALAVNALQLYPFFRELFSYLYASIQKISTSKQERERRDGWISNLGQWRFIIEDDKLRKMAFDFIDQFLQQKQLTLEDLNHFKTCFAEVQETLFENQKSLGFSNRETLEYSMYRQLFLKLNFLLDAIQSRQEEQKSQTDTAELSSGNSPLTKPVMFSRECQTDTDEEEKSQAEAASLSSGNSPLTKPFMFSRECQTDTDEEEKSQAEAASLSSGNSPLTKPVMFSRECQTDTDEEEKSQAEAAASLSSGNSPLTKPVMFSIECQTDTDKESLEHQIDTGGKNEQNGNGLWDTPPRWRVTKDIVPYQGPGLPNYASSPSFF